MARPRSVPKAAFAARAVPGAEFAVRVTPAARQTTLVAEADGFRIAVPQPAAEGRANDAVQRLLARALGVAPGRLTLVAGATARDKRFRLD